MSRVKGRGGKSGTRRGNERDEVLPPKKNVRGRYRSKKVEKLTKNGELISIDLAVDVNRVVGDMARLIVNYLGRVLRTTVSFRDGTWDQIAVKHGPAMFTKMKDKFKPKSGMNDHTFEAYSVMALRKAFRTWKNTLHGCIHQVVNEERAKGEDEPHMNRDEILKSVLGERSGHVRGKGCGTNPIGKKRLISEAEVEARVAFAGQFQATGSNSVDNSPTEAQNQ
ncbi:uncharacterized protein G2W53_017558 [Senna tora]|uniref:Uncharacterized protein n=1 Tax=Senna tora TaxID=362788 RepID=A0A834TYP7_9FABA|nr:uncharacterized protein G2W53_017558 [Senna tora]